MGLIGITIIWWIIFLILYFRDKNTLKNAKEVEGTIIGKSFKVVFLGRGEFIVRAKVVVDNKRFYSYTGVSLLDFIAIRKKEIKIPCKVLMNENQNKHAIIYFKDAIYNMERDSMNQPVDQTYDYGMYRDGNL